jgi:signal transduction histidine kinase
MSKKAYTKPEISREQLEAALYDANEKLLAANKQLQDEEQARIQLFSNLSHDLRSPVTALASAVDYLKSSPHLEEKEYEEILNLMSRRITTLQTMLNDLFLLTKVSSPTVSLELETVDAGFFLESFFYTCEVDLKYENRILKLNVPETFPYEIEIDTEKIIRVLDNLFSNALRYSKDQATIMLGASYHSYENGIGEIYVTVTDTGLGIDSKDLPHIFKRSYRASRSRTPNDGGSGLGLSIAKGIVERHGGKIWCESTLGEGSTFTFTLPVKRIIVDS